MDHFQQVCKAKLQHWYNGQENDNELPFVTLDDIYVVWSVKALQNYKALLSTSMKDGIYAEFTYNGDKQELYMDVYKKKINMCFTGKMEENL